MLRKWSPSDSYARLELVIIGTKQRGWIARLICRRALGRGCGRRRGGTYGRLRREAGPNIQVDQSVVEFGDGRLEVPAQSDIDAEVVFDAPIVVHESIQPRGAVVFVGVPVGDGTGSGIALQEIGEIVARERAGKEEAAARILLRQLI